MQAITNAAKLVSKASHAILVRLSRATYIIAFQFYARQLPLYYVEYDHRKQFFQLCLL